MPVYASEESRVAPDVILNHYEKTIPDTSCAPAKSVPISKLPPSGGPEALQCVRHELGFVSSPVEDLEESHNMPFGNVYPASVLLHFNAHFIEYFVAQ